MPRRLALILAILLSCRSGTAAAATLDARPGGSSLGIGTSCARHVDVRGDAGLHDRVAVHATADHQEELDHLRVDTGPGPVARLRAVPGGCWRPRPSFSPTLDLAVRVPTGFALSIDDAGGPAYAIDGVGGPLALDLSGAVRLRDADATTLTAALSGDDTVALARIRGAAQVELSGSGSLDIDEATISALALSISGVGRVTVAGGRVGSVALSDSGEGSIRIGATVGGGSAEISGLGSIRLARVTGPLTREVGGLGTIDVGN